MRREASQKNNTLAQKRADQVKAYLVKKDCTRKNYYW